MTDAPLSDPQGPGLTDDEAARKLVADYALGNESLHANWRCGYPDTYGPCNCVDEFVADVVGVIRAASRTALVEAADECDVRQMGEKVERANAKHRGDSHGEFFHYGKQRAWGEARSMLRLAARAATNAEVCQCGAEMTIAKDVPPAERRRMVANFLGRHNHRPPAAWVSDRHEERETSDE